MILALETVFEQCSVAFLTNDGDVIAEQTLTGNRQQTQQILPMIHAVMNENHANFADLTAIAFNRGPGAFSGIRINTAVAQALAFSHDLPCLPVSSLQAVAQTAFVNQNLAHVYAVIDARMNEVYFGEYQLKSGIMGLIGEEKLLPYGAKTDKPLPLVGNGAELLTALNEQRTFSDTLPTACMIGRIGLNLLANGEQVSAENALPVYLRHNAWKTLAEQGKNK